MRKPVSFIAATLFVATIVSFWTGCRTASWSDQRETTYVATTPEMGRVETPVYDRGARPPKPMAPAPARPAEASNEFTLKSDLLQLMKRVPARATLGQTVENDLVVTPLANCANVVITDTIPDGATYVRSEPNAQVNGKTLTWRMDTLDKGNQTQIKVWYKADREGDLVNCATMDAIPRGCALTVVGSAKLVITCQLPANANVGAPVNKMIEVKNIGTATAQDVVVTDTLPAGLSSASGQMLTFNVGDLAPGQAKQITAALKATERGPQSNAVTARASNAEEAKSDCPITINQPGINITKDGTKHQFLGRNATYNIVVSNTGDTDLQNVVVTDQAPAETRIVSAEGGSVSGNTATWKLATLAKGDKQTLGVVLTSAVPGSHCNAVSVTTADGLSGNAQACTLWKGVPAILLETKDDPDPVGVGETTTYTISVTNQGTADDNNVKVVANFGKEIDPVSASSGGTVGDKTVTFPTIPTLAAKQKVTFTIVGKGISAGDHRLKVNLTSDMLTEPVTHEESTHVY